MTKINITVCMGSSCYARGNEKNLAFLEHYIQENALDAEINLSGILCQAKCADGPNIIINDIEYHNVDEEKLVKIIEDTITAAGKR